MLTVTDISVSIEGVEILSNASIVLKPGSLTVLQGTNGSGKTTLLNVISGLVRPLGGAVALDGRFITQSDPVEIARLGITRVLQQPSLVSSMSVLDNVQCGSRERASEAPIRCLFLRSERSRPAVELHKKALDCVRRVGLASRCESLAGALSYGEMKLVALARALMYGGRVFLLDEILAGLGTGARAVVLDIVSRLTAEGAAVLCVEHDPRAFDALNAAHLVLMEGAVHPAASADAAGEHAD